MHWDIREAQPDDINFIYSTWMKSYRYNSRVGKSVTNTVYYPNYNRVIDDILSRALVLAACLRDDPTVILGYIVSEPEILHFIFVKESFRRLGVAKSLYQKIGHINYCTHLTRLSEDILDAHREITHNPFILYKQKENKNE